MAASEADFYFQRFGFCGRQIKEAAPPELGLVVVIPCFHEPDLIGSLASLWHCDRPACAVEIIVVINSALGGNPEARAQNQKTLNEATAWAVHHNEPRFKLHLLHFPDLPPKQAGVGLARKIGMDEALRRFGDAGNPEGIIVCFDADCRCERNYLGSIERHFRTHPRTPACSIHFEHPLTSDAIIAYELHLRYYVEALRYAGFPYAHHTIGSSMAVRADVYRKQGGMNKRQAGEDFYFLQKIFPLGDFTDLNETTVIPSPRVSDRVPFGTGKAVGDYVGEERGWTYPLQAFLDLKELISRAPEKLADGCSEPLKSYLTQQGFDAAMTEIGANTSSAAAFRKRFFQWFNGFQAMKFVHHARDHSYGRQETAGEALKLLRLIGEAPAAGASPREVLEAYRELFKGRRAAGGHAACRKMA